MSARQRLAGMARTLTAALMLATGATAQELPPAPEPPVDPSAPLFDDSVLHDIRLRIHSADWARLRQDYRLNTYYPCDFVWAGQVVRNVGIRSRGSGSRNPYKPGLRVDFNRYATGQEFLGLKSVVLDNLYQDSALIRERLSMKFFERMELPAPREAFVRLFVNEEYVGLYAIVESIDKRFLKRVEGLDDEGYLYEYEWNDLWWFTDLGDDLEQYKRRFPPKTHETDSYATLFRPIREFVYTVNNPHDVERDIGAFLDIRIFLRQLAVDAYLADWDGLVGDFGINNFYLYRQPSGQEFRFLPWDKDNTFKGLDYPVWPDGMSNNVLTSRLVEVDELRNFYLDALLECARAAEARDGEVGVDGQTPPTWLEAEIERQYQQILEAVKTDPRRPMTLETFENAIEKIRAFARSRGDLVRATVANKRRGLLPPRDQ